MDTSKTKPPTEAGAAYGHDSTYDADEFEFIKAMDAFKRKHNVRFPTLSHALKVLKSLGYRKAEDGV